MNIYVPLADMIASKLSTLEMLRSDTCTRVAKLRKAMGHIESIYGLEGPYKAIAKMEAADTKFLDRVPAMKEAYKSAYHMAVEEKDPVAWIMVTLTQKLEHIASEDFIPF